jgi:hypothetical protein
MRKKRRQFRWQSQHRLRRRSPRRKHRCQSRRSGLAASLVRTFKRFRKSKRGLTLAEGGAVGDDLRGVRAAGLVGAVTDTVGEVALVAEAGGISVRAAKGGGLGEHALHALLL